MYGLQLMSIATLIRSQEVLGAALFAIVLNLKHIYLYQAPPYFVFLFAGYCFHKGQFQPLRFIALGPFMTHLPQVVSRLFPFKRGLCHAYWAPNFWALYSFADRIGVKGTFYDLVLQVLLKFKSAASLTRGLVQESEFGLLPNVSPLATLILSVIFQLVSRLISRC
jgi:alpha-1,3-glucosyltransferase